MVLSAAAAATPDLASAAVHKAAHTRNAPAHHRRPVVAHRNQRRCQPLSTTAGGAPRLRRCGTRLLLGVTEPGTDGTPQSTAALRGVASRTGHALAIAADYQGWAYETGFDVARAQAARAAGAVEEISWEPWDYQAGVDQPAYRLRAIADGQYDTFVRTWAAGAHAYGGPILLRFAAEMNGYWTSWSVGQNGNTAQDFVDAWRHVHDVIRAAGATNVAFDWNPNVSVSTSPPLASIYPGDAYVDVVALDGYNFGTAVTGSAGWQSFAAVFARDLARLARIAPTKPVLVGETASAEAGGSKSAWIRDMVKQLLRRPQIVGFNWFDFNKETDWRIASTPASARAMRAALRGH